MSCGVIWYPVFASVDRDYQGFTEERSPLLWTFAADFAHQKTLMKLIRWNGENYSLLHQAFHGHAKSVCHMPGGGAPDGKPLAHFVDSTVSSSCFTGQFFTGQVLSGHLSNDFYSVNGYGFSHVFVLTSNARLTIKMLFNKNILQEKTFVNNQTKEKSCFLRTNLL